MDKLEAIQVATEYVKRLNSRQPVSIDTRNVLDKEPIEFNGFWCFKSYYEDLNQMRGDGIKWSGVHPFYLISKETKEITLIGWEKYNELKK